MSKKEKVAFIRDSFVDKAGVNHQFVIAAVSIPLDPEESLTFTVSPKREQTDKIIVSKALSLGYAFCNANDSFKPEIGEAIASGRARKYSDKLIFTNNSGMINTEMVNAILRQEAQFVKTYPELFIRGLDK